MAEGLGPRSVPDAAGTRVPCPDPGSEAEWVSRHLGDVVRPDAPTHQVSRGSGPRQRGGQSAADDALTRFDVRGYAAARNEAWPESRRGASRLSPYIRHGLLPLPVVWERVGGGPARDVTKFRDELLWQEYARHLYARLGTATARGLRYDVRGDVVGGAADIGRFGDDMVCVRTMAEELESTGWIPNQARMWLASHWAVRLGRPWQEGENYFFAHLLDGSRAANRAGWQWTVGALTGKAYGFSRWQVDKRAPGLCATCPLHRSCPIQQWPPEAPPVGVIAPDDRLRSDPDPGETAGPSSVRQTGTDGPEAVWLTAESLGDGDPALAAHPSLPAVFVFDRPLLGRLGLSRVRLEFLAECLADLGTRRHVEVHVGDPVTVLAGRRFATTFAPVPGWRRRARIIEPAEIHPWPWLVEPHAGSVTSFTAWRRRSGR